MGVGLHNGGKPRFLFPYYPGAVATQKGIMGMDIVVHGNMGLSYDYCVGLLIPIRGNGGMTKPRCADCSVILGALYRVIRPKYARKRIIVCTKCADIRLGIRDKNGRKIGRE